MADGNSGSGCGWVIGLIVLGLIGAGFLYQREGGKIFDPPKSTQKVTPKVMGLSASWDTGVFTHDLLLTNEAAADLTEVELTVTLHRLDGDKPTAKQFWSNWKKGEVKKFNLPSHQYQKVTLQGAAYLNSEKHVIDTGWTWDWDRDSKAGKSQGQSGNGGNVAPPDAAKPSTVAEVMQKTTDLDKGRLVRVRGNVNEVKVFGEQDGDRCWLIGIGDEAKLVGGTCSDTRFPVVKELKVGDVVTIEGSVFSVQSKCVFLSPITKVTR